jgi:hypothetical protein
VDRVAANAPYVSDPGIWTDVLKAFRSAVDTFADATVASDGGGVP